MALIRVCPSCGADYEDTQTLCTTCPDTPAVLKPGTLLPAALALGEVSGQAFRPTTPLGNDNFTVHRHLGWGGMAIANLVTDRTGAQRVIKEMRPVNKPKTQAHLLGLFLREAEIQYKVGRFLATRTQLFTPLPKGFGCFERNYGTGLVSITRHYMVMEFMEGQDWDSIQGDPPNGALPMLDVLQLGMEVCIILRDYLHGYEESGNPKPILHRDIKPANIQRLRATGTSCLLDFGIARPEEVSAATMARGGTRAGSASFAPPEHGQKGVKPTTAFDTYCVCSTMYTLLANEKEFPEKRQDQLDGIRANIKDPELQRILTKGTNEGVAGRYLTAEELRSALEQVYTALRPALPSHLLQPVAPPPPIAPPPPGGAGGGVPAPGPAPAPVIVPPPAPTTVTWDNTQARLLGSPMPNRFSQVLSGRVMRGGNPLPAVNVVISRIIDDPGGAQSVNVGTISTDIDGCFALDSADTTTDIDPNGLRQRRISIRVEDTSGVRLTDSSYTITQPKPAWRPWPKKVQAAPTPAQAPQSGHASQSKQKVMKAMKDVNNLSLVIAILMVILLAVAIGANWPFLGWFAFLGGPFAVSVVRHFGFRPRRFFPKFGMFLFGAALLIWLLFTLAPAPKQPSPEPTAPVAPAAAKPSPTK